MQRAPPPRVASAGRGSGRLRAPAPASLLAWEISSLAGGAYYRQLLLLSPATTGLPQPTASPGAPSPPAPSLFSPPPPTPTPSSAAAAAGLRCRDAVVRAGSELRAGGAGGGRARMSRADPGALRPPREVGGRRSGAGTGQPQAGRAQGKAGCRPRPLRQPGRAEEGARGLRAEEGPGSLPATCSLGTLNWRRGCGGAAALARGPRALGAGVCAATRPGEARLAREASWAVLAL